MDVKEEEILGDRVNDHWYYVAKGRALRQFIGDIQAEAILDVGAGSGCFSRQLLDHQHGQRAICVDPNYAEERAEEHHGKPISFVRQVEGEATGLILMMDVLEHVEDDVALLKQYAQHLPQGGHIAITVPAFQFLWSGHDVFLEHYRRYNAEMIERVVTDAGLELVKTRYFFATLFPLVALIRVVKNKLLASRKMEAKSELSIAPNWLNRLLIAIHHLESKALFSINKMAGLTVFCLCKK